MRAIETTVTVTDDQQITITLPSDIIPGRYYAVFVIDEIPLPSDASTAKPLLKLNAWEWKNCASESTFRREDIYDDDRV
ncbi:MAG: hypothetical protein KME29_31145 [Calothrix sp. FI2-JRJ7]|jgi:hypothetical protein|nr:hypothetical protein [Calothrix sp. FI2-JRJ7]